MNKNKRTLLELIYCYTQDRQPPSLNSHIRHFFQKLFQPNDIIAFKRNRHDLPTDAKFADINEDLPPPYIFGKTPVFILNPVKDELAQELGNYRKFVRDWHGEIIDENPPPEVRLNAEAMASFGNFRFEYDDDADGHPYEGNRGKADQLSLIKQVNLPFTALLDSGGKSIHVILGVNGIASPAEHRLYQLAILARLPGRVDPGTLSVNYPEWIPGVDRTTKDNVQVTPHLIALGRRISKDALDKWISSTDIQSPYILDFIKTPVKEYYVDEGKMEEAIQEYMSDKGITPVSQTARGYSIRCPFHEDRTPSAIIFKSSGVVFCSSCEGTVDRVKVSMGDAPAKPVSAPSFPQAVENNVTLAGVKNLYPEGEDHSTTVFSIAVGDSIEATQIQQALNTFDFQCCFVVHDDDDIAVITVIHPTDRRKVLHFISELKSRGHLPVDCEVGVGFKELEYLSEHPLFRFAEGKIKPVTLNEMNGLVSKVGHTDFWIKNWFPEWKPRASAAAQFRQLKYVRYLVLLNENIKAAVKMLAAKVSINDEEHENWKKLQLEPLIKTERGKAPTLAELAGAGVSLEYLCKIEPLKLGIIPKFREIAAVAESYKKPVVAAICEESEDGKNRTLYKIVNKLIANASIVIVAPPGYGKTTFLQNFLPENFRQHFQTVIVCRERIHSAFDGEEQANNPVEPNTTLVENDRDWAEQMKKLEQGNVISLQSRRSGRLAINAHFAQKSRPLAIGKARHGGAEPIPDEEEEIELPYDDDNEEFFSGDHRPEPVLAVVGYDPRHCLKPNPPASSVALRNFCEKCPFTQCRSNPVHRQRARETRFVITTHQSLLSNEVTQLFQRDENAEPVKRDLVISDEKPHGVFEVYKIKVNSDGSVVPLDHLIRMAREASDFTLTHDLNGLRTTIVRMRENARIAPEIRKRKGKINRFPHLGFICRRDLPVDPFVNLDWVTKRLQEIAKRHIPKREPYFSTLKQIDALTLFGSNVFAEYDAPIDSLVLSGGRSKWASINKVGEKVVIMDATAHIDPDYSMPDAPDITKINLRQKFENLTIHCTAPRDIGCTRALRNEDETLTHLEEIIRAALDGNQDQALIVLKKDIEEKIAKKLRDLPGRVHVNHFGNLKGDNAYRNCRHLILGHVFRWLTVDYLARASVLFPDREFVKSHWTPVMEARGLLIGKGRYGSPFREPSLERLRLQYEACEFIQTIMRTALRNDTKANVHVWIPSANPQLIGILLDYFVGARVVGPKVKSAA